MLISLVSLQLGVVTVVASQPNDAVAFPSIAHKRAVPVTRDETEQDRSQPASDTLVGADINNNATIGDSLRVTEFELHVC